MYLWNNSSNQRETNMWNMRSHNQRECWGHWELGLQVPILGKILARTASRALQRWSQNGEEPPCLFHLVLWRSQSFLHWRFNYTEIRILRRNTFTTLCVNAISFDYVILQPKLLYIFLRNMSICFWWLKYLMRKYSIQVYMAQAKRVLHQWTGLEN